MLEISTNDLIIAIQTAYDSLKYIEHLCKFEQDDEALTDHAEYMIQTSNYLGRLEDLYRKLAANDPSLPDFELLTPNDFNSTPPSGEVIPIVIETEK